MTGPDHYRKAEELTQKAHEYLGQGDGHDSAAVSAANGAEPGIISLPYSGRKVNKGHSGRSEHRYCAIAGS
jgi:hypothetical protein